MMVPLRAFLILSAALFAIGLYGVLSRRNAVTVLMSVELMLNAVNVNLIAFWRYREVTTTVGQAFAAFVYIVAAAEVAVGLALVVSLWRTRRTVALDEVDLLQG
jgi:NADH-quinone oxidoreductase subunit K